MLKMTTVSPLCRRWLGNQTAFYDTMLVFELISPGEHTDPDPE